MEVITPRDAAELITDGSTVIPGGFGSCGHPDLLTHALEKRFIETGTPQNIRLLFASGAGDRSEKGINRLAHKGLVHSAIGGYWGLCPKLVKMAETGEIEGHNWPQGIVSNLFKEIASGSPGIFSRVGIGTFVDPRLQGGLISPIGQSKIHIKELEGQEYLFYPTQKVDYAFLRGTECDTRGNITMSDEAAFYDAQAQAQAVKACGGIVIVQVKKMVAKVNAQMVKIPGFLVDYIVVSENEDEHLETYGHISPIIGEPEECLYKKIIAKRALKEIPEGKKVINLGIGIPALIGTLIEPDSKAVLTIESGAIGGNPLYDLSFGASVNPEAVMEQAALFNFYDGGGIDVAFLGFGEIDSSGCINASKFGNKYTGAGGFINIAQAAKKLVFCGSLTTKGLVVEKKGNNNLTVVHEGEILKFVDNVEQITVNRCTLDRKEVMIITERAVFKIEIDGTLTLTEIAPGISVNSIQKLIKFPIRVSQSLVPMTLN